jgi:hypothetical protein
MRNGLRGFIVAAVAVAWTVGVATSPAFGQAAGAASQAGTIPRGPDGKPDFSGVWQVLNTASWDILDHSAARGVPGGQGVVEGNEIPYLPQALAKKNENFKNRLAADPVAKCFLPGVPRIMYMPYPFQIFQTPTYVAMVFEFVHAVRHVYMNSAHQSGTIEWWMGDSRGKWDGDTLVVDAIHFNADTWFDAAGNHHSAALHLVERYSFIDRDHINYEVTVEDPKTFTRPWKMSMPLYRRIERNVQVLDYECHAFDER